MSDSLFELRVRDICQREVVSVSKDDTVSFALSLMVENRTSALPVVNTAGKCLGMISASDVVGLVHELDEEMDEPVDRAPEWLVSRIADHDLGRRKVSDLMSSDVASILQSEGLHDAAASMLRNKVHRLPVLDGEERIAGIISTTDILKALVDHRPASVSA